MTTPARASKRVPTELGLAWLDTSLEAMDATTGVHPAFLMDLASRESQAMQLAILRGAVHWIASDQRGARLVLSGLVVALYRAKLPFDELDIVEVLRASRHGCGHGDDLAPPLELAIAHARKHGLSDDLVDAVRAFAQGLRKVSSAKAQTAKRKAAFLLVLATDDEPSERNRVPWSQHLRASLDALPAREKQAWREAVLHMALNDVVDLPKAWETRCTKLVRGLGAARVAEFVSACWPPEDGAAVFLDTASSHVLKNLVWLLAVLKKLAPEHQPRADTLVVRLAARAMKPDNLAEKVAVGAALYLAQCPPDIALGPLRELEGWSRTLKRPGPKVPRIGDALAVITSSIH